MKPEEALNILDRVAAIAAMNRQDHLNAQQAIQTLREQLAQLELFRKEVEKK